MRPAEDSSSCTAANSSSPGQEEQDVLRAWLNLNTAAEAASAKRAQNRSASPPSHLHPDQIQAKLQNARNSQPSVAPASSSPCKQDASAIAAVNAVASGPCSTSSAQRLPRPVSAAVAALQRVPSPSSSLAAPQAQRTAVVPAVQVTNSAH